MIIDAHFCLPWEDAPDTTKPIYRQYPVLRFVLRFDEAAHKDLRILQQAWHSATVDQVIWRDVPLVSEIEDKS